jgi:hypothetical protein
MIRTIKPKGAKPEKTSPDKPFTSLQPREGDVVLHCEHFPFAGSVHFYKSAPGVDLHFERPDGTTGVARWLVCCPDCHKRHGPRFPVTGDAIWRGNEPVIRVDGEVN